MNKNLIPKNLMDFEKKFNSEETCVEYIVLLKFPEGYKCVCGHNKYWIRKKYYFRCLKCRVEHSILTDTIFEYSKKPLMLYFRAIWYIVSQKNGSNAMNIQRILGLGSYNTAWAWLQKLRRSMVRLDSPKLSGTVEVDETLVGGPGSGERKRGRGSNKLLVVIGAEIKTTIVEEEKTKIEIGRIKMQYIEDASSDSLHPFIQENIDTGSTLITDDWNGYCGIETKGYFREIHKSKKDDDELEHIHLIASLLKRWLLGTMQGSFSKKYIDYYLDEFAFRFNRRKSKDRGLLFYRLMEIAISRPSTTIKEIKKEQVPTKEAPVSKS